MPSGGGRHKEAQYEAIARDRLNAHRSALTDCYDSWVTRHRRVGRSGNIDLTIDISPTGGVSSIEVTRATFAYSSPGTLRDEGEILLELSRCVVDELQTLELPTDESDDESTDESSRITVSYHFSFN